MDHEQPCAAHAGSVILCTAAGSPRADAAGDRWGRPMVMGEYKKRLAHHQVLFRSAAGQSPRGEGAASKIEARPSQWPACPVQIAAKESSLSRGAAAAVRLQTGHWHIRDRQQKSPACEPQQDWLALPRLCQQESRQGCRTPGPVKDRAIPVEGPRVSAAAAAVQLAVHRSARDGQDRAS